MKDLSRFTELHYEVVKSRRVCKYGIECTGARCGGTHHFTIGGESFAMGSKISYDAYRTPIWEMFSDFMFQNPLDKFLPWEPVDPIIY